MEFKLFSKLGSLHGLDLVLLLIAAALAAVILFAIVRYKRSGKTAAQSRTRALVYGALCLTLSFVLSYFKLFSLFFGGSVTLFSMLPIMLYASVFGPAWGFGAGFAYALLQVIQGAYIVHPVQFVLDYFVAFTCLGLPSLFPKQLTLGIAAAGTARMLASTVSGAVFFASSAPEFGIADPWIYSFVYNFLTVGIDTLLDVLLSLVPAVKKLRERMN